MTGDGITWWHDVGGIVVVIIIIIIIIIIFYLNDSILRVSHHDYHMNVIKYAMTSDM
jgi:hypothetical protein